MPILGLVDDAIIIPAGIWLFLKLLPPGVYEAHRAAAMAAAERPRSMAGMAIIVAIWGALALSALAILRWVYA